MPEDRKPENPPQPPREPTREVPGALGLRAAYMKALVDCGDTSRWAQTYVAQRMWRFVVWHLWRSGGPEERQAARLLLKMLKGGEPGRPTTEHKRMKIACQVETEIEKQRKEGASKKGIKERAYGIIAAQLGEKDSYVKDAYIEFKDNLAEAEAKVRKTEAKANAVRAEAEARAQADEAKAQADAAFYRDADKWE